MDDRRIAKSVTNGAAPAQVERMVYDGDNIALTFDGNGNQTHRYLYGPGVDQVLADENAQGKVLWALADNEGTVRDLVDSSGTVQNHITYDSFGNITSQTNSAVDFRYGYTGQEFDKETGQYYYRARYLDPFTGTFISADTLGFGGGDANLYRYVGNSPTNATDPSGNFAPALIPIAGGAILLIGGTYIILSNPDARKVLQELPKHSGDLGATIKSLITDPNCPLSRILNPFIPRDSSPPPRPGGFGSGPRPSIPTTGGFPGRPILDPRDVSPPPFPHRPLTRQEVANLFGPRRPAVGNPVTHVFSSGGGSSSGTPSVSPEEQNPIYADPQYRYLEQEAKEIAKFASGGGRRTIAVALVQDSKGNIHIVSTSLAYFTPSEKAKLEEKGYFVLPNTRKSPSHAELLIIKWAEEQKKTVTAIGVSHNQGICPFCWKAIQERNIKPGSNLAVDYKGKPPMNPP